MKRIIFVVILSLVFLSCKNESKVPETFDYGSVKNGYYDNSFFKFKLPINPDWYILNEEENNEVYDMGNEVAAGDNDELEKRLKNASEVNLAKLITLFKVKPGTNIDFNPSIIVNAENLKSAPQIKTNEQYLKVAKSALNQTALEITFLEEKDNVKLGTKHFSFLKMENVMNGIAINQDYYLIINNGFALSFILSYTNEDDRKLIYNMMDKLKI